MRALRACGKKGRVFLRTTLWGKDIAQNQKWSLHVYVHEVYSGREIRALILHQSASHMHILELKVNKIKNSFAHSHYLHPLNSHTPLLATILGNTATEHWRKFSWTAQLSLLKVSDLTSSELLQGPTKGVFQNDINWVHFSTHVPVGWGRELRLGHLVSCVLLCG